MSLELRHLSALAAVVDAGTFTDAAIQLQCSQAAVSRAILALETQLGAQLLSRSTRHVALTPLGERILTRARRVLLEVSLIGDEANESTRELRVGYAWSTLGGHTSAVQRSWRAAHPESHLVFRQSNTATAGLLDGEIELAVFRTAPRDPRIETVRLGEERRVATLAKDDPLARKRTLALDDFAGKTMAVDARTGTTVGSLWPADRSPVFIPTSTLDEWLTLIADGDVYGVTSEATAAQHPRPGIVYRPLRDAPAIEVRLAWWRGARPALADELAHLIRAAYDEAPQLTR
ncbi:LysR family transcriptional regulator [Pseudoclavibacter sp. AY1F1]|uniref:LysR family transcriptional regulator n=1 Tax=Pseudoclavibacter sp. AY1F1 TaxID=2080583 RepID=UPI000CE759E9|nr:LysR family transcriptional regulator [Pseudoclavibacter sp. AY1F1]PPF45233.1 LysR family transcriptional regulator [Pseudoclavibacter sp. AY1F1]